MELDPWAASSPEPVATPTPTGALIVEETTLPMPEPTVDESVETPATSAAPAPARITQPISVIVLTWNEEANIEGCLRALAAQTQLPHEVLVVDAASEDQTVAHVLALQRQFPVPLRLDVASVRITVGAARNRGAALAQAPIIAFLSADAEPEATWIEEASKSIDNADLVFGRQVHAPRHHTVAAAVRGLRYHFPNAETDDPTRYASHVNAVMRKTVLQTFPIGETPGGSAVDDILLARRASKAGFRLAYNPAMSVRHHDVETFDQEMRKNRREGLGLGEYGAELGRNHAVLAWGAGLLVLAAATVLTRHPAALVLLAAALWLPAARRAARRFGQMPFLDVVLGFLAAPVFDLAFLLAYVQGSFRDTPQTPQQSQHNQVKT